MSVVALDIGSSRIKALLACWDGQVIDQRSVPTPVLSVVPGEWTYPAEAVDGAAGALVASIAADNPDDPIDTIVFSCLGTAMVPLDREERPLAAAMAPADARPTGGPALSELVALSSDELWHMTGSDPAVASSLLHLLWWRHNHPEVMAKVHRFRSLRGFIVQRLCGADAEDRSWASRTMLVDLDQPDDWSRTILAAADLEDEVLPQIRASGTAWPVHPLAASRYGLQPTARVVLGAIDNCSALLGATDPAEPQLAVIVGTYEHIAGSSSIEVARAAASAAGGVVHTYPLPGRYLSMTRVPVGHILARIASTSGLQLEALLASVSAEPKGLEMALDVDAVQASLEQGIAPAEVMQAVLESAAAVLRRFADSWAEAGHQTGHLVSVGGGSGRDNLMSLKANVLGRTLSTLTFDEGAGYGALRLAAMSVQGASPVEACELFPNPPLSTWLPDGAVAVPSDGPHRRSAAPPT